MIILLVVTINIYVKKIGIQKTILFGINFYTIINNLYESEVKKPKREISNFLQAIQLVENFFSYVFNFKIIEFGCKHVMNIHK